MTLDTPADLHVLIDHQVWARIDGDTALVGITALGIRLAGEIYMCRPKSPGSVVEQGRGIAVVELAKSIVSVKSPVGGTVVEANPLLEDTPELAHAEPYGRGWLARVRLANWPADAAALVHGDALAPALRDHAALYRITLP